MENLFGSTYKNKKVLVTGHTGFKGSWLSFWLTKMGARVVGYALEPETKPNHFNLISKSIGSVIGDIVDEEKFLQTVKRFQPDIIFHLAAQPLVRLSYAEPHKTFETNIMGTINVLEAVKQTSSVKAVVNVTTDKCYDNKDWIWGYRENDPMGGHDPYSASKGCSELVTASYRASFFNPERYKVDHDVLIATARSGNVLGGGDWATDRLIPDIVRATVVNEKVCIRSPQATRPWQHVLEPLSGYLLLGQKLLEENPKFGEAWNFGPSDADNLSVKDVLLASKKYWSQLDFILENNHAHPYEALLLKLDCSKASSKLKWQSVWNGEKMFEKTMEWYRLYYDKGEAITGQQLIEYVNDAAKLRRGWAIEN